MPDKKLPVTVPIMLHDDMAEALGEPFAISYLCGAIVSGRLLRARTRIAAERSAGNPIAIEVLRAHGLSMGESLAPHEREPLPGQDAVKRSPFGTQTWKPSRPITPEERREVGEMVRQLAERMRAPANRMDWRRLAKRQGEADAEQAERLWPSHRDRMRAR